MRHCIQRYSKCLVVCDIALDRGRDWQPLTTYSSLGSTDGTPFPVQQTI